MADLSATGSPLQQFAGPFIISAGLGALIGLVRQWAWQQEHAQEAEYAGVRTFTIWAVLGCATALMSERFGVAVLPVVLAGLCLYLIAARVRSQPDKAEGYTTFAVMMETFFLGALVQIGERSVAVMLAAGTMVLLGSKRPISRWTRKFTSSDMFNVLQFVAITGVVLPLVPNQGYGPFAAFNPYDTWLMVVIMAGRFAFDRSPSPMSSKARRRSATRFSSSRSEVCGAQPRRAKNLRISSVHSTALATVPMRRTSASGMGTVWKRRLSGAV